MSQPSANPNTPNPADAEPLDPVLERVQTRLRRLMLIAGLTLGVGMFAVFAAILYRIVALDTSATPQALAPGAAVPTLKRSEIGIPAAAELADVALDGATIVLTYTHAGGEVLVVIDAATQVVTRRLDITKD
ncbi:MAG: hypothetical protein ACTSU0_07240 [Alphaproteobacteria bacterium]